MERSDLVIYAGFSWHIFRQPNPVINISKDPSFPPKRKRIVSPQGKMPNDRNITLIWRFSTILS